MEFESTDDMAMVYETLKNITNLRLTPMPSLTSSKTTSNR